MRSILPDWEIELARCPLYVAGLIGPGDQPLASALRTHAIDALLGENRNGHRDASRFLGNGVPERALFS